MARSAGVRAVRAAATRPPVRIVTANTMRPHGSAGSPAAPPTEPPRCRPHRRRAPPPRARAGQPATRSPRVPDRDAAADSALRPQGARLLAARRLAHDVGDVVAVDELLQRHHRPDAHLAVGGVDAVEVERLEIHHLDVVRVGTRVQLGPAAEDDGARMFEQFERLRDGPGTPIGRDCHHVRRMGAVPRTG